MSRRRLRAIAGMAMIAYGTTAAALCLRAMLVAADRTSFEGLIAVLAFLGLLYGLLLVGLGVVVVRRDDLARPTLGVGVVLSGGVGLFFLTTPTVDIGTVAVSLGVALVGGAAMTQG